MLQGVIHQRQRRRLRIELPQYRNAHRICHSAILM
jgi:hypothetical protein